MSLTGKEICCLQNYLSGLLTLRCQGPVFRTSEFVSVPASGMGLATQLRRWKCKSWWRPCSLPESHRIKYGQTTERIGKHHYKSSRNHQSFSHDNNTNNGADGDTLVQHLDTDWPMVWICSTKKGNHKVLGHEDSLKEILRNILIYILPQLSQPFNLLTRKVGLSDWKWVYQVQVVGNWVLISPQGFLPLICDLFQWPP